MWIFPRRMTAVAVVLFVAACSSITYEGGGAVTLQLTANKSTVVAGGSVTFSFQASGTALNGVIIDYGDGAVDSVGASGAQTAEGSVSHAFQLPGSYTVVGRAEDGATGTATAEVAITVSEG